MTGLVDGGARAGVGLIVPPLDVRLVLEKTAEAVSKKPALEAVIKQRCATQPKFSFLFESDPYHPYYKSKLTSPSTPSTTTPPSTPSTPAKPAVSSLTDDAKTSIAAASTSAGPVVSKLRLLRSKGESLKKDPVKPPPENVYTISLPTPPPSALELDVIKLTAQFVAQNGEEFQGSLQRNECRNNLFDFLKPMHQNFPIFQRLVEAYSEILRPTDGTDGRIETLRNAADNLAPLMQRAMHIDDWKRLKGSGVNGMTENGNNDQRFTAAAANVNWHNFTTVATIDINSDDDEALPNAIVDSRELPRVLRAAEKEKRENAANLEAVDMDMDMDMDEDGDTAVASTGNVHKADVHSEVPKDRILAPQARSSFSEQVIQEPSVQLPSGQVVPRSKVEESVRVELFDASYKDERNRAKEKNRLQNLATDTEMVRNLAHISRDRKQGEVYNRADLQSDLSSGARAKSSLVNETAGSADINIIGPPEKRARIEAARAALNTRGNKGGHVAPNDDDLEDDLPPPTAAAATPAGLVSESDWLSRVESSVPITVRIAVHSNKNWDAAGQTIELKAGPGSVIKMEIKERGKKRKGGAGSGGAN